MLVVIDKATEATWLPSIENTTAEVPQLILKRCGEPSQLPGISEIDRGTHAVVHIRVQCAVGGDEGSHGRSGRRGESNDFEGVGRECRGVLERLSAWQ